MYCVKKKYITIVDLCQILYTLSFISSSKKIFNGITTCILRYTYLRTLKIFSKPKTFAILQYHNNNCPDESSIYYYYLFKLH